MHRLIPSLCLIFLLSGMAFGQTSTSGALLPFVTEAFPSANGVTPDSLGFVCTFAAGTTTPLTTYQDSALQTANQNPVRLSSAGRPINGSSAVSIYMSGASYKVNWYAAYTGSPASPNCSTGAGIGTLIRSVDNVYDIAQLFRIIFATKNLDNVRLCDQWPGADAGEKITNCIADLPSTGGTADARGFEGLQAITSTIVITKAKVHLLFSSATFLSSILAIQVKTSNVTIDCARGTIFNQTGAADTIDIGDGGSFYNDNIIRGCTFSAVSGSGSSIKVNQSTNTIVEYNSIQNPSTGSNALWITGSSNNTRLIGNTVGSVAFHGISIDSGSDSPTIIGNRVDGNGIQSGQIGMIASVQGMTIDSSNTFETLELGLKIQAGGVFGPYFLANVRDVLVQNGNPSNVVLTGGYYGTPDATSVESVFIDVATNFSIHDIKFAATGGAYSGGAPIKIGSNAFGAVVGPNLTTAEANEVVWPTDIGLANVDLVSEHKYFAPKNLAGNSFNVWPGGTSNSPPGTWLLSGVNHARATDSPSGKYSEDLIGQVGISLVPFATISATENARVRGRYISFTFWARNISGSATSQLRLQLSDGVTTTSVDRTVTASWAQYTEVVKVGPTAIAFSATARNLNAVSTLRVAGPSLYLGSTVMVGEIAAQQNAGLITLDVTDHALTGSTSITSLTTVAMDSNIMGTGGAMHVVISGTLTGTAGAKTIEVRPNSTTGTVMATVTCDTSSAADWVIDLWIFNVTAGSQRVHDVTYWKTAVNEVDYKTAAFAATSAAWTLGVYGTLADAGDTITVKSVFIEPKNGMPQ